MGEGNAHASSEITIKEATKGAMPGGCRKFWAAERVCRTRKWETMDAPTNEFLQRMSRVVSAIQRTTK
uniref:Uncharacterized protein n=1 Tax=Ascaris lumbricoides TaxID=6252 RepID=A0A0M3HQG8_ASCLU